MKIFFASFSGLAGHRGMAEVGFGFPPRESRSPGRIEIDRRNWGGELIVDAAGAASNGRAEIFRGAFLFLMLATLALARI